MMQVPKEIRPGLIRELERIAGGTSQSTMPAVYGMAAAAEVKRIEKSDGLDTVSEVRLGGLHRSASRSSCQYKTVY